MSDEPELRERELIRDILEGSADACGIAIDGVYVGPAEDVRFELVLLVENEADLPRFVQDVQKIADVLGESMVISIYRRDPQTIEVNGNV